MHKCYMKQNCNTPNENCNMLCDIVANFALSTRGNDIMIKKESYKEL